MEPVLIRRKERLCQNHRVTLTLDITIFVAAIDPHHHSPSPHRCRSPSLTTPLTFGQPPPRLTSTRHSPTLTTTHRHHHSLTPTVVAYLATNQSVTTIGQKQKP
ncbi:hypothetical protein PIB30_101009 [Stylosanthes scabra]|uniref:Uncharacterized protein n=1 Tax=Stylosanthes scabra TaxID=79078 RepID=A0ABU6WZY3_9FABA|nr:hypothetical protein [Stylosanthes scabra]